MQSLAVVCPGQGSQSVGMLKELSERHSCVKETFEEASSIISFDLWRLVQEGPKETLNLTENTQPALVAASVATWRYIQSQTSIQPQYVAGHSLGEFSALVISEALSLSDAVKTVRARGRLMSEALEPGVGGMLAVLGLEEAVLQDICGSVSQDGLSVSIANVNAPGQIVLAGHTNALEKAAEVCKEKGAKRAISLPVSGPFHSPLIKAAAEGLEKVLADISIDTPKMPVVQNVTNQAEELPEQIKQHLVQQVTHPVNWVGAIQAVQALGVQRCIEVGPGKVLTGLNKRIDRGFSTLSTDTPESIDAALEALS